MEKCVSFTSNYKHRAVRESSLINAKPSLTTMVMLLESAVSVRRRAGTTSKCSGWTSLNISLIIIVHDILLYWQHEKQTMEAKVTEGRETAQTLSCWTWPFLTSLCWTRRGHQRSLRQEPWRRSSHVFWLWWGPPACCSSQSLPGPGSACSHTGPGWISAPLKEGRLQKILF